MAEFKTAEQYVVARLEEKEAELEVVRTLHKQETAKLVSRIEKAEAELNRIYNIINSIRDSVSVKSSDYYGKYLRIECIYAQDNPEMFDFITEYFDLPNEEDEEDE